MYGHTRAHTCIQPYTHLISQDVTAFVLHAVCSLSQLLLTEHHHTTEVALDCAVWQLHRESNGSGKWHTIQHMQNVRT